MMTLSLSDFNMTGGVCCEFLGARQRKVFHQLFSCLFVSAVIIFLQSVMPQLLSLLSLILSKTGPQSRQLQGLYATL